MNSAVLELLGGKNCKIVNETDLSSKNPSTFTATISGIKQVHNLFPGVVLFLGYYKQMGTITIAVSNHEIVRYLNLKNIDTWNYCNVTKGQYLGETHSNKPFQIEYCSQWKGNSSYPVRVDGQLYFKQNPISMLKGEYSPINEINIQNGVLRLNDKIKFTEDQLLEWGPTSIDNSDQYVEGAQIVGG